MANITVKHLLDGISEILQDTSEDESKREWPLTYLVDCYNLETRQLVVDSPDACVLVEPVKLVSGKKHSIPADGIALIGIIMNMGTDGLSVGDTIIKADLGIIGLFDPGWASATADSTILNFMTDPGDPRSFYTYPPADGTSYVLIEYSVVPDQITYDEDGDWESEIVGIREQYLGQLEKNIISRAYSTDSDLPGNMERQASSQQL